MILHQFNTSLNADNAYQSALPLIGNDDSLLFMGEALYGLLQPELCRPSVPTYVLAEDVIALGLEQQLAHFKQIDYAQWVHLTQAHDKVISW
ncbi:sulfurtransferase complex subunit TusB [Shewanella sp. C32]|uniref:Sulfurtransferase complex subunit TusB n=1 Tax=Shewanella electrica TaxID=515560 RepID=A0ABT2FNP0_9GAMM|nr:sulfurtransferase complex subunit TusB [Shewanella electrica]MCH1926502.1 sulfurtransferase complex subunit TusB [Shewanella electrica]MCS4557958.1 sulfurtransferase complex subunit TusB [Shewanella electrica]